jgi:riboflavin biosynthesis pyrimidine reductase
MQFERAVPPGPPVSPQDAYASLELAARAPADRPYVVCNFIASADGKATAAGRTAQLGSEGDRAAFHLLRTQADAVLAGTETLRVERYGALVRQAELVDLRRAQARAEQPLAVIVSRSGRVPFEIPLFADPASLIALYAPAGTDVPGTAAVVHRHELPAGGDLATVLRSLRAEHDVRSLLCEGGPSLFTAMLAEGLVDELFLTLASTIVGGGELGITTGTPLPEPLQLRLVWALEQEGYLFLRYRL